MRDWLTGLVLALVAVPLVVLYGAMTAKGDPLAIIPFVIVCVLLGVLGGSYRGDR